MRTIDYEHVVKILFGQVLEWTKKVAPIAYPTICKMLKPPFSFFPRDDVFCKFGKVAADQKNILNYFGSQQEW